MASIRSGHFYLNSDTLQHTITLPYTFIHSLTLHCTPIHSSTLIKRPLLSPTFPNTLLHTITPPYTQLHSPTLFYIPLHTISPLHSIISGAVVSRSFVSYYTAQQCGVIVAATLQCYCCCNKTGSVVITQPAHNRHKSFIE